MKIVALVLLVNYCFINSFSQIYSGQLINGENGQPILFANIGISGKNIGTVSDANGCFKVVLNSKFDKDTLRISCIGYEKKTYLILDLKDQFENADKVKIELLPKSYLLDEAIIYPSESKSYTLGNFCESNSTYGNAFYSDILGTEMGVIINLPPKKNKAFLKNFRFYIGEFTFDKFPVRLNIYDLKNNKPFENILAEPIFLEITSAGEYIVDLEKYNIITNGDFFISLEYYRIANQTEGKLILCAVHHRRINKGNGYYRLTSQGDWKSERFANVGFSVQVECEK